MVRNSSKRSITLRRSIISTTSASPVTTHAQTALLSDRILTCGKHSTRQLTAIKQSGAELLIQSFGPTALPFGAVWVVHHILPLQGRTLSYRSILPKPPTYFPLRQQLC